MVKMESKKRRKVDEKFCPEDENGKDIFEFGGESNELGDVGAMMLQQILSGYERQVIPYENMTKGRPALCLNFYEERDRCLRQKILFEDPEFPAEFKSIFPGIIPAQYQGYNIVPSKIIWRRPGEIINDPQLIVSGTSRFDARQGTLGNCYMIAATATLAMHEDLFYRVVPPDQDFGENYAGIFHFQFWRYGKWVDVVIDDRLPTKDGNLVFMKSQERNEFWSALLEKAYAKMYGSYSALIAGQTHEVMEDYTGGLVEYYHTAKVPRQALLSVMTRALKMGSMVNCGITTYVSQEQEKLMGLVGGHAYSITEIAQVTHQSDGDMDLIRVRNPYGNALQWTGSWGDGANEWNFVSEQQKGELGVANKPDGEFWMSFNDFVKQYTKVDICTLGPECMEEISQMTGREQGPTAWETASFDGRWCRKDMTAGGRLPSTLMNNPQYLLHLPECGEEFLEEGKRIVILTLVRKYRREMGASDIAKAFFIYSVTGPTTECLNKDYANYHIPAYAPRTHLYNRDVTKRVHLDPGYYVVIPSTWYAGDEAEYLLRVIANGPFEIQELKRPEKKQPVSS